MIDYFGMYTKNLHLIDLNFLEKNIDNFKKIENKGFIKYTGSTENLTFVVNDYGLFIKGSPATYTYGHNIKTLKHHDIRAFLDKLSDALNYDAYQSKLYRIDLTDNLEMESNPILYKKYMGKCQYLERVADYEYNGLIYRNKSRDVLLYGKIIQMLDTGKAIPIEFLYKNLWRYEYRIKKKINKYLDGCILTRIDDLMDPDNFRKIIDVWEQMFKKIELIDVDALHQIPYHSNMNHDLYMQAAGVIASGGLGVVLEDLKEQFTLNRLTKRKYDTRKEKYISAMGEYQRMNNFPLSMKDELIQKLEAKAEENRMMV